MLLSGRGQSEKGGVLCDSEYMKFWERKQYKDNKPSGSREGEGGTNRQRREESQAAKLLWAMRSMIMGTRRHRSPVRAHAACSPKHEP